MELEANLGPVSTKKQESHEEYLEKIRKMKRVMAPNHQRIICQVKEILSEEASVKRSARLGAIKGLTLEALIDALSNINIKGKEEENDDFRDVDDDDNNMPQGAMGGEEEKEEEVVSGVDQGAIPKQGGKSEGKGKGKGQGKGKK